MSIISLYLYFFPQGTRKTVSHSVRVEITETVLVQLFSFLRVTSFGQFPVDVTPMLRDVCDILFIVLRKSRSNFTISKEFGFHVTYTRLRCSRTTPGPCPCADGTSLMQTNMRTRHLRTNLPNLPSSSSVEYVIKHQASVRIFLAVALEVATKYETNI